MPDSIINFLEQKNLAFLAGMGPAVHSIFYAEHQHKRILASIGAKERDLAFWMLPKKAKFRSQRR